MRIDPPDEAFHYSILSEPRTITPTRWIANLSEYQAIERAIANEHLRSAAEQSARFIWSPPPNQQNFWPKAWLEAAMEQVRQEHFPEEVSRLDAVFAFAIAVDTFDALASWASSAGDRWVWRCRVPAGAEVSVCDLDVHAVFIPDPDIADLATPQGWLDAWEIYRERARRYWSPRSDTFTRELLIRPSLDLVEKIHLRDLIS